MQQLPAHLVQDRIATDTLAHGRGVHLIAHGRQAACRADELRVGVWRVYNYGYLAEVTKIEPLPGKSGGRFRISTGEGPASGVRTHSASTLLAVLVAKPALTPDESRRQTDEINGGAL